MMRMRNLSLIIVLGGLLGPLALAQTHDDPLVKEFERFVEAAGGGRKLQDDSEYQRSRSGWDAANKIIVEAISHQDLALTKGPAAVEEAMTLYSSRATSRGDAVDHYLFGRILGLAGHLDDAYRSFTQALQADRYFFWAWDGLGVYHSNKEHWSEAKSKFERVLQLNKGYLKSAFGRAQCLFKLGDVPAAAIQLREILDHPGAKNDPLILRQTRLLLAEAYRGDKNYDAAIRELNALEQEGMKDIRVYVMRAWCARQLERWTDAIADYDAILKLDAREYRYELYKASCLMALGRNGDAISCFERYLSAGAGEISAEEAESIRNTVEQLKARPAVEDPKKQPASLQDLCSTALHSPHDDKRREAIIMLSKQDARGDRQTNELLRSTFAGALKDKDPHVLTVALEQMNTRYWDPVHLLTITKMLTRVTYGRDPMVRGMAASMLYQYDPKETVPVLIMAMQEEPDLYVFRCIHETLNAQTLAWIYRVLPDDLEPRDIADVRAQWVAWYAKHRDIFRRNEPQGFQLGTKKK